MKTDKIEVCYDENIMSCAAMELLDAIGECADKIDNLSMNEAANEMYNELHAKTANAFCYFVHWAVEEIKYDIQFDIEYRKGVLERQENNQNDK